ncbi:TAFII28-domain-containing protein [Serendipita vermifera]|nr:TAFII28-domain-containing protein [Serendipita vermifera]
MNNDNIDPALQSVDLAAAQSRMKGPVARVANAGSREGTPQRTHSSSQYSAPPAMSQTQQIQRLFESNPNLQQLQIAANKATEVYDDEEGEELDDEQLANSNARARENLHMLLQSMTPDQLDRFHIFRRSGLNKTAIKKVVAHSDHQMSNGVAQLLAGVGKVFVGEIIAKAREVQYRWRETGPLTPEHVREAYRLYKLETGNIGPAKPLRGKKLFRK